MAPFRAAYKTHEWDIAKACPVYSIRALLEEKKPGFDI